VTDTRALLRRTAELAADFLDSLEDRPVFPQATPDELRASLGVPLQDEPLEPEQVVEELAAAADPGLVAIPSGRYFGFVIGGGLPAALAADWLTSTWDQNAGLYVTSPANAVVEEAVAGWLLELLGLPSTASLGFTWLKTFPACTAVVWCASTFCFISSIPRPRPSRMRRASRRDRHARTWSSRGACPTSACRSSRPVKWKYWA